MGWLISLVVTLVVAALVIWVVGRLNLGMTVSGFGAAFIAAIVIAVVAWVVYWLLGLLGLVPTDATWLGWILTLIIAAVVLMFSDRFVPGMTVNGFTGALVAAIGIAVVGWIISWILGLLGIGVTVPPV